MRWRVRCLMALLAAGSAVACTTSWSPTEEGEKLVLAVEPEPFNDVDFLFVVDGYSAKQPQLDAVFATFGDVLAVLDKRVGGRPAIHVGVVSADRGIGRTDDGVHCSAEGGKGRLQTAPQLAGCSGVLDSKMFLSDVPTRDGRRDRNFHGSLEGALRCIGSIRSECPFTQPLEATVRALRPSDDSFASVLLGDDTFLGENSLLVVVIVTAQDDCSVSDPGLFSDDPALVPALGPLDALRCFRDGVYCRDLPVTAPNRSCTAREDSKFLKPIAGEIDAMRNSLRRDSRLFLSIVSGGEQRVWFLPDGALHPVCDTPLGTATPALRLGALRQISSIASSGFASICDRPEVSAIVDTNLFAKSASPPWTCLPAGLLDIEPKTPGIQPSCHVYDAYDNAETLEPPREDEVPHCDSLDPMPRCFDIVKDDACDHASGLRLVRKGPRPAETFEYVNCLVP